MNRVDVVDLVVDLVDVDLVVDLVDVDLDVDLVDVDLDDQKYDFCLSRTDLDIMDGLNGHTSITVELQILPLVCYFLLTDLGRLA